jgi:hypothetical protein
MYRWLSHYFIFLIEHFPEASTNKAKKSNMFIGHFSAAYFTKLFNDDLPLWILMFATQATDLLFVVFKYINLETSKFNPKKHFIKMDMNNYWSHSVIVGIPLAAFVSLLVFAILSQRRNKLAFRNIFWLTFAAGSHFWLDAIVHERHLPWVTPDILKWFGVPHTFPRIGLNMWANIPSIEFHLAVELMLTTVTFIVLIISRWSHIRKGFGFVLNVIVTIVLYAGFSALVYLSPRTGDIPASAMVTQIAILNVVFMLLGLWTDAYVSKPIVPSNKSTLKSD